MNYKKAMEKLDNIYSSFKSQKGNWRGAMIPVGIDEFEAIKEHIAKIEEENEKLRLENVKQLNNK